MLILRIASCHFFTAWRAVLVPDARLTQPIATLVYFHISRSLSTSTGVYQSGSGLSGLYLRAPSINVSGWDHDWFKCS